MTERRGKDQDWMLGDISLSLWLHHHLHNLLQLSIPKSFCSSVAPQVHIAHSMAAIIVHKEGLTCRLGAEEDSDALAGR